MLQTVALDHAVPCSISICRLALGAALRSCRDAFVRITPTRKNNTSVRNAKKMSRVRATSVVTIRDRQAEPAAQRLGGRAPSGVGSATTTQGVANRMTATIPAATPRPGAATTGGAVRPLYNDDFRFAFLSFRPFPTDFRRYLMAALQSSGHDCVHVFLGRRAMELRSGESFGRRTPLAGLAEAAACLRRFFAGRRGIVVNCAGNSAPDVVLRLWAMLRHHVWIYDVYDWLLYDSTGLKRLQWWLTVQAYASIASRCCVLSSDLSPSYRRGFHLDNASHLAPSSGARNFGKVVVTAYYDRRTDFELINQFAQALPEITIDMYGAIYKDDPVAVKGIDHVTGCRRNVRYHGRFEFDHLQEILDQYSVGLLPYRSADVMTRFVNPDKLFHYLCAGLEVITTPLPAVRRLEPYVHIATDAQQVMAALDRIQRHGERRNPGNLHQSFNWQRRAQELCEVVAPAVRTS